MSARACCRSRRRPNAARSIASPRCRSLPTIAHEHGVAVHMDGARLGNALARMNVSPAEVDLEGRRRCALVRRHQGRRDGRGGGDLLRSEARRQHAGAGASAAARSPRSTASSRRRSRRSWQTTCGSSSRATPTRWRTRSPQDLTAAGCKPVWPVEANEVFAPITAAMDKRLKAAGAMYYPWSRACRRRLAEGSECWCGSSPRSRRRSEDVERFLAIVRS